MSPEHGKTAQKEAAYGASSKPARSATHLALAALPLCVAGVAASPLNPEQMIIKPPDVLQWKTLPPFPPGSVDTCALTGETTAPGLYYTLVRWHPGYMSAPHFYSTDRYCMVLSGT